MIDLKKLRFGRRVKFYNRRTPMQILLRVVLGVVLFSAALIIFLFFYLQKFIVITADGLKVEAPFLSESYTPEPELIIEEAPEE